jgi:tetratricopeptide (TPR) repeat protein
MSDPPPRRGSGASRSGILVRVAVVLAATLVLLEIGLRVTGSAFLAWQDARNRAELTNGEETVVLCIGESTTALGGPDAWPAQLDEALDAWGQGRAFAVVNRGVPGTDSSVLATQIEANLDRYRPAIVVAMMGANDRGGAIPYDPRPVVARSGVLDHLRTLRLFRQLLHRAPELPKAPHRPDKGVKKALGIGFEGPGRLPALKEARSLAAAGDGEGARRALAAAIDERPDDVPMLLGAAAVYQGLGDFAAAETTLDFAAARCREPCGEVWLEQAWFYELILDEERSEAAFRRVLAERPGDPQVLAGLGRILGKEERWADAAVVLEQAIRARPDDVKSLATLGEGYAALGRTGEAQDALHRALAQDPADRRSAIRLVDLYQATGDDAAARAFFAQIERTAPDDDVLLGRIELYHHRRGEEAEAARYAGLADAVRQRTISPMTRDNYRFVHTAAARRGLPLVAVQYPTRPLEPLEHLFEDRSGVWFVDNESTFRDALAREPYEALFWDACYGDFGHCTRQGNRLLAENVARVILGEILGLPVPPAAKGGGPPAGP